MSNLTAFDFGMRLGCKVMFKDTGDTGTIFSVDKDGFVRVCKSRSRGSFNYLPDFVIADPSHITDLMLVLRRLESITEEEVRELYKEVEGHEWDERPYGFPGDHPPDLSAKDTWFFGLEDEYMITESQRMIGTPAAWRWLMAKGFDLDGYIDAGLAVDEAKLKS